MADDFHDRKTASFLAAFRKCRGAHHVHDEFSQYVQGACKFGAILRNDDLSVRPQLLPILGAGPVPEGYGVYRGAEAQ